MSIRTVEQKMDSSSLWNGAAPAGSPVLANDIESYAEGTDGGLFDFGNVNPIGIHQVMIKFGTGTTSWALSLVDVDAVETVIASASSASPYVSGPFTGDLAYLIILQGQKLKLTSIGGPTTASRARISVDQYRT